MWDLHTICSCRNDIAKRRYAGGDRFRLRCTLVLFESRCRRGEPGVVNAQSVVAASITLRDGSARNGLGGGEGAEAALH
jgi:hypothetical protein